jgi:hypothetical protein
MSRKRKGGQKKFTPTKVVLVTATIQLLTAIINLIEKLL